MKNLVLITKGLNTWQTLFLQLNALLGGHVSISGFYLDGKSPNRISGDLILISSKELLPQIRPMISSEQPVIFARRSINHHEIEKLFDIPDQTEVLLVNDAYEASVETVSLLLALGIDHIHYHPYAPGLGNFPQLKIAVTPGEPDCVPPCVEHIVDIKSRNVDITTLVEIIEKLGLLDLQANILSASYIKDILHLIRLNRQNARTSHFLSNKLQTIINTVHDGILAVDETNTISVMNPVAESLLSVKSSSSINKKTKEVLCEEVTELLSKKQPESIMTFNNRQIVVTTACIEDNHSATGFVYVLKDVSEIKRLEEELRRKTVQDQQIARYTLNQIIGDSPSICSTVEKANRLAASDSPILILGESGTGKELLAQGIHNASPRRNGPFIAVNFAALTESLIESELFGYEEGSFTGARRGGAIGLFEQAHKGTIFLDEIGDSPIPFQIRILRVLQEKQIRRIGSAKNIPIDVRVISATNHDLKDLMAKGLFRKDLYYRLNVLPLNLPPLRERGTDKILLAKHHYEKIRPKNSPSSDKYFMHIEPLILDYDWPGNIRELQNVIEYIVNISPSEAPLSGQLPQELRQTGGNSIKNTDRESESDLFNAVLQKIVFNNQKGHSVGRRSLAVALNIPENTIRQVLDHLSSTGQIIVHRGRKGITAADSHQISEC